MGLEYVFKCIHLNTHLFEIIFQGINIHICNSSNLDLNVFSDIFVFLQISVETMMHLTCTNMPVEKIDHALDNIKNNGIQNVLALRGDPPHGQDKFVQVEGGFSCALDLVYFLSILFNSTEQSSPRGLN